jgi:hypothetical protein
MKQLENNVETHNKVYLEIFNICSTSFPANVSAIFLFYPCTPQLWLIDVGCGL